jgi:diguanylate cyclase (GGDEF)-like protein
MLRLDLLERSAAKVQSLLAAPPAEDDPATAAVWLSEAEELLNDVGEFDRTRLLSACAAVHDQLARHAPRIPAPARPPVAVAGLEHVATRYTTDAIAALRAGRVSEALDLAVRGLVAFDRLPASAQSRLADARMAQSLGQLCCEFFDYERALRFHEIAVAALPASENRRRWTAATVQVGEVALIRARELTAAPAGGTGTGGSGSVGQEQQWRRHALLRRVEEVSRQLIDQARPRFVGAVTGRRLLAGVLCEQGAPEAAWPLLELAGEAVTRKAAAVRGQAWHERAALQLARGRCLQLLDRPREALTELDAAVRAFDADQQLTHHIHALRLRSAVRETCGDAAGALADMRRLSEQIWARHQRQIGGFMDQVWERAGAESRRRDLEARQRALIRTAEQDPLTGLENRRGVQRFCAAMPSADPICLVMVDIDHFKAVNDSYGHAVGDAALREIATVLSTSVRAVDRVARWGGEEFLIALPAGSADLGAEAAARVRRRVADHDWQALAGGLALTLSAGVACGPAGELSAVLRRADDALYEAKRTGRNRVITK